MLNQETKSRINYTSKCSDALIELQQAREALKASEAQLGRSRELNALPNLPLIDTSRIDAGEKNGNEDEQRSEDGAASNNGLQVPPPSRENLVYLN